MKNKTITLLMSLVLYFGYTHAAAYQNATNTRMREIPTFSTSVKNYCWWIELGDVSMSAYFDNNWHWATATLYKSKSTNFAYRVRYEGKYYAVKTQMDGGEIKCSVLIPYHGEKRWFSFTIPCG